MKWDQIAEQWSRMSRSAKERWNKLSDADLELIEGDQEELIARLEQRYGWPREKAENEVHDWAQVAGVHPSSFNRPDSLKKAG